MFALSEAGIQIIRSYLTPRFGCASRGANRVAPLRGAGGKREIAPAVNYSVTPFLKMAIP